jgi:hypothetical protein
MGLKIFTKPYYVYILDDEDKEYQSKVYVQDINWATRNQVTFYSQSPVFQTREEAEDWGERQVEALSK